MLLGKEISETVLGKLYRDLTSLLGDINTKRVILRSESRLLKIVEEYCKKCGADNIPLALGSCSIDKICALQMILWNCVYYNFYEKNVCNLVKAYCGDVIMFYFRYHHKQFQMCCEYCDRNTLMTVC